MAILVGIGTKLHKSAGDWTYSKYKDQIVAKQKMVKPAVPARTFQQMEQRAKMANVVNFWNITNGFLKCGFEASKGTQSQYNCFIKYNLKSNPIVLTKEERERGTVILSNYVVSYGTLKPTVTVESLNNKQVSSLCVGSLVIDATTTQAALASALLQNNSYFRINDRIEFFRASQIPGTQTSVPTVNFKGVGFTLAIGAGSPKVWELVGKDGFSTVSKQVNGQSLNYLCCDLKTDSMVAWSVSRTMPDDTVMATTQSLQGSNSLAAQYSTKLALYKSIVSLGGVNKENFFSPDYVDYKQFVLEMEKELAGLGGGDNQGGASTPGTGSGTGNTDPTTPPQGGGDQEGGSTEGGGEQGGGSTEGGSNPGGGMGEGR